MLLKQKIKSLFIVLIIDLIGILILVNYNLENSLIKIKQSYSGVIFSLLLILVLFIYFDYLRKFFIKSQKRRIQFWDIIFNLITIVSILILSYIALICFLFFS